MKQIVYFIDPLVNPRPYLDLDTLNDDDLVHLSDEAFIKLSNFQLTLKEFEFRLNSGYFIPLDDYIRIIKVE